LAKGLDAHETANELFYDDWQRVLEAQDAPEALTRADVAALRARFSMEAGLERSEQEMRAAYERLLDASPAWSLPLTDNVVLERTDIETLVNDLAVRDAEREQDPELRRQLLLELDRELSALIASLPREDWGKRLELQELFLFRRLVHDADAGHLVTVEHSTPREDFRREEAVDMRIAVAGETLPLQVKTFKSGTHSAGREQQAAVTARAKAQLEGSNTRLVQLETEAVQQAYETAVRQLGSRSRMTLADKYEALRPLMEAFPPMARERLLRLVSVTEEDLVREQEAFEAREAALRAHQAVYFLKEEERMQREREAEEEERMAVEERARIRQAMFDQGTEKIRTRAETAAEKRARALARLQEGLEEAEARRVEEARAAAEEAAKEAKREALRKKREAKEALGWPPKTLLEIAKPPLLIALGFLDADWQRQPMKLVDAKKRFLALYAQPKKGKPPTEKDAPNALFKETFPTLESLAQPQQQAA